MNISNGQLWKYSSFIENNNYSFNKEEILNYITKEQIDEAYSIISNWKNYKPTPLLLLDKLSKELGLNKIYWIGQEDDMELRVTKKSSSLAAEVTGVDLSKPLSSDVFQEILQQLSRLNNAFPSSVGGFLLR